MVRITANEGRPFKTRYIPAAAAKVAGNDGVHDRLTSGSQAPGPANDKVAEGIVMAKPAGSMIPPKPAA